jgi:hypothetical protein
MSTAAPDALDRLSEAVAERSNPIVVKEVRQGLRTRAFWVFFILMLVANLFISLVAVAFAQDEREVGPVAFGAYFAALALVQFFVIPYVAFRSMAREREDETWVLLTLTGLGPRRILRGKLASAVLQGLLYASVAAPFLLFSYYLNGIELPAILVTLAVSVAYQVFLTSIGVSMATLANGRASRAALNFLFLGFLLFALFQPTIAFSVAVFGGRGVFSGSGWLYGGALTLFVMVSWAALFYEAAAARLSLATELYTTGPRLTVLVQVLGALGFGLWAARSSGDADPLRVTQNLMQVHLALVGIFLVSDRDGKLARHERSRWPSLLKPGALRGFQFIALLSALSTITCTAGTVVLDNNGSLPMLLGAGCFSLLYLALSGLMAAARPAQIWQRPTLWRAFFFGFGFVVLALTPAMGEIFDVSQTNALLYTLHPVLGMKVLDETGFGPPLVALAGLTAVAVLALLTVLGRRDVEVRL